MASAYSTSICRSSTALPRDPSVFRVRRATMFGNGLYVGTISGNPSRPVRKNAFVRSCNACAFARLLYRAFRHRFFRATVQEDRGQGIFIEMTPPSNTIRIIEPDQTICVVNECCQDEVLEALEGLCGPTQQCSPEQIAAVTNWWLTGDPCTAPPAAAAENASE